MTPRRVLFITSERPGAVSGNVRALQRFMEGVRSRGIQASAASLAELPLEAILAEWQESPPDVIHGLHAYKAGRAALEIARRFERPLVITVSGTDLDQDFYDEARRGDVLRVLRGAGALTIATRAGAARLRGEVGIGAGVFYAPKGITPPPLDQAFAEAVPPVLLLPAGFRPVKNNLFAIEALLPLAREFPGLKLRLLGPVLDAAYYRQFETRRGAFPFVEEGGCVPPEAMPREYAAASVVLNASHSENAAHAVLEAMLMGKAVLAADIPGNRELIAFDAGRWEESTGVLYRTAPTSDPRRRAHDPSDFRAQARRLLLDPARRTKIGQNARARARAAQRPETEIEAILQAYAHAEDRKNE